MVRTKGKSKKKSAIGLDTRIFIEGRGSKAPDGVDAGENDGGKKRLPYFNEENT
jgi:hypothetical protein